MFRKAKSTRQRQDSDQPGDRIAVPCTPLVGLCEYAVKTKNGQSDMYRELLRRLHAESTAAEELIDNCGAQYNETWYPFRETVAAVKLFSFTCYNLLHIQDAAPRYRLIKVEGNFYEDTVRVISELTAAVAVAAKTFLVQAKHCKLVCRKNEIELRSAAASLPHFDADRKRRHVRRTGETVVYLSTAFLNLTTDRDVANVLKARESSEYDALIPESVNEENLRLAEARFHNLQSHYDTYIFESDIESRNSNLPILRGHISVIYHLLQIATSLAHYYERHMSELRRKTAEEVRHPLSVEAILRILFEYLLGYARRFMNSANNLCRSMIQSYSERREIEVPIPMYRGFHVRPSTLLAKIVAHYGSSVTMTIDNQEYNAGLVFDLFRANERINALKRRQIAVILSNYLDADSSIIGEQDELKQKLQFLFLALANDRKIILYDTNLSFNELETQDDDTMLYFATRYIAHYMSASKIDVESTLTATFEGDNRALIDINLLAENGYGEDRFGNNIVLPEELSYLRT